MGGEGTRHASRDTGFAKRSKTFKGKYDVPKPGQLIVSVDTEEEGLWGGVYTVHNNKTDNLRGLNRFQSLCERWRMPPTYLIDAPVLDDGIAVAQLKAWQDAGVCEVGAHCHPWCNPPIVSQSPNEFDTFLCNLPRELQFEKLNWLTCQISERFERPPTSYRAGRYGFDLTSAEILADLGYVVDSSVLPLHDYRSKKGPDFMMAQRVCYQLFSNTSHRKLIEFPVTAGFTRAGYKWRRQYWQWSRRSPWKMMRIAGLLDRLGIARRVKLSPEGTRLDDLEKLIDAVKQDGVETLVLMLHSSSLVKGLSPYARDDNMLEQLYTRLEGALRCAIDVHGFRPATLTQAAKRFQ